MSFLFFYFFLFFIYLFFFLSKTVQPAAIRNNFLDRKISLPFWPVRSPHTKSRDRHLWRCFKDNIYTNHNTQRTILKK